MFTLPKSSFVTLSQKHVDSWSIRQVYFHGGELHSLSWSCGRLGKVSFPVVDISETFLFLCEVEQSLHGSREACHFCVGMFLQLLFSAASNLWQQFFSNLL